MTDAIGNVLSGPGASSTPFNTNIELLAATGSGYNQDGVTLRTGAGTLATGQPLVKHDDGTYGPVGDDRLVAATVTFTDSGDLVTTPAAHSLSAGDEVKVATVTTTTGITANTTYFVKTTPSATTLTLSATNGGSTLALTTDGTGTNLTQLEDAAKVIGFLRDQTDTGLSGSIPKLGNRVYKGVLKYSVIKAANGNVDLTAAQLTALGARLDLDRDYFIF